jgi:hypothetical protein
MATRFYLHNATAPYTPATFRGAWDATGSAVTKKLDAGRLPSDAIANVAVYISGTAPYDVCFYRGVSGPLSAGTIGTGTVNLCVGVRQDGAGMDGYWHLHIFVTQGDSDTVRGTLLNDYVEDTTNELYVYHLGKALQSAQSLSSVVVSAGDRIVVELGIVKRGSSSSWCWVDYGTPSTGVDLSVGADGTALPGWIEFSETFSTSETVNRVSQGVVETAIASDATTAANVSQGVVEVVMEDPDNPARITQAVAEILQAQTAQVRLTQLVTELLAATVVESRVTQLVAELLTLTVIESRTTQAVVEILNAKAAPALVTQLVIEMLAKTSTYVGPPAISTAGLCGKPDVLAWLEWTVPMRET